MRDTKSRNNEEQKPTITPRRSPRFLHQNQTGRGNERTLEPAARRTRILDSFSAPLRSSIAKTQQGGQKGTKSKSATEPRKGSKRPARLERGANLSRLDSPKQSMTEKMVTRSSVRQSRFANSLDNESAEVARMRVKKVVELKESEKSSVGSRRSARSDRGASLSRLDLPKQSTTEKKVTRSLTRQSRFVNSLDNESVEISRKRDDKVVDLKESEKSGEGSRRSARLKASVSRKGEVVDSQKQNVVERRTTRSSVRVNKVVYYEVSESSSEDDCCEIVGDVPKEGKREVVIDSCKQRIGNIDKKVTRSSSRTKMAVIDKRKPGGDGELSKISKGKSDVKDCVIERGTGGENCTSKMNIGEKRKRYQVDKECENFRGWTEEQELALRRAYFTAKPTPHFWKEVARMVPGKSAKECFDRIHLDQLTPSQPRRRSRANRKEPSPLSFSASRLLSPAEMKTKKLRSRRSKLLAQKTVRQLLEKQQNEDQDYEADLFAVLESTMEPSLNFDEGTSFASPVPNQGSGLLARGRETSSSSHKKQRPRSNSSFKKAAFVSPPVLKQIRNKALHEKYIDQLHCRDAKRKAESLRNVKRVQDKNGKNTSCLEINPIKVAKDALVSDAQDVISQIRKLHSCTDYDTDEDEDEDENNNISCNDEDEDKIC